MKRRRSFALVFCLALVLAAGVALPAFGSVFGL